MKTEIENAIKALTTRVTTHTPPDEVLKITQGALNLAHVLVVLKEAGRNTL